MDGAVDGTRQGKELLVACVGLELHHTAQELVAFGQGQGLPKGVLQLFEPRPLAVTAYRGPLGLWELTESSYTLQKVDGDLREVCLAS